MSTNHNRIKVVDLEKNQPDKILVTNQNGELEFSDISHIQTQNYNALDYTIQGKALDARQGKVLKDMIENVTLPATPLVNDLTTGGTSKALTAEMGKVLENTKLTASLATDAETQITAVVTEDKKVISRLKLFNWWQWIKSQAQTISGTWNFTNKVTLAAGTTTTPSLIIPNGTLTSTLQNGAVERDSNGNLFTTSSGERNKIVTEKDAITVMTKVSGLKSNVRNSISTQSEKIIKTLPIGFFPNKVFGKLNLSVDYSFDCPYTGVPPTIAKVEYFLKLANGFYSSSLWGTNNLGQLILFKTIDMLSPTSMNTTYTEDLSIAIRTNYANSGNNGNPCGIGIGNIFYNIRKADNSDNELPANCQFDIVERITWKYADANNDNANNAYRTILASINAFYIEKII